MRNLSNEVRDALMEQSEWKSMGITLDESVEVEVDEVVEEERFPKGTSRAKRKAAAKAAADHKAVTDAWEKKDAAKHEKDNEVVEEAELHVCPLCTTELSEALDEETLTEHLDVVLTLVDKLSAINEGEEVDMDSMIEGALEEIFGSDEE